MKQSSRSRSQQLACTNNLVHYIEKMRGDNEQCAVLSCGVLEGRVVCCALVLPKSCDEAGASWEGAGGYNAKPQDDVASTGPNGRQRLKGTLPAIKEYSINSKNPLSKYRQFCLVYLVRATKRLHGFMHVNALFSGSRAVFLRSVPCWRPEAVPNVSTTRAPCLRKSHL